MEFISDRELSLRARSGVTMTLRLPDKTSRDIWSQAIKQHCSERGLQKSREVDNAAESVARKLTVSDKDEAMTLMGFLTKRGDKVKNWKRRYFVLRKGDLSYFEDKAQALEGNAPLNFLLLQGCSATPVPPGKYEK